MKSFYYRIYIVFIKINDLNFTFKSNLIIEARSQIFFYNVYTNYFIFDSFNCSKNKFNFYKIITNVN